MYCSQCGNQVLEEESHFCDQCGNLLKATSEHSPAAVLAEQPTAESKEQADSPESPSYASYRSSPSSSSTFIYAHWYTLIEGLQTSSIAFYSSVERAIRERQIPEIKLSHIDWKEGGLFSAKRVYLRVQRRENIFDICGAPFGTAFFVSWWRGEPMGCLYWMADSFPLVGGFLKMLLRPPTYYRIDTGLMFQSAIHGAILEVIDGLTEAKGLRALSDLERKPILHELQRR